MIEGVGKPKKINRGYTVGVGYIILPKGTDRDKYIKTCYRKERVAIQLDHGLGIIPNCYITTSALREIVFPEQDGYLGSCVAFMGDEYSSAPIIVGVVTKLNETQLLDENIYKKSVATKDSRVDVEINGNTGEMFINVDSQFENGGAITVNLNSKNNTSKFKVNCFGDISLYSEGDTSLETLKTTNIQCSYIEGLEKKTASRINLSQEGMLYEDKNGNSISATDDTINIVPKTKLKVFEGKSPMVLGDELKKQLEVVTKRIDNIRDTLKIPDPTKVMSPWQILATASLSSQVDKEDFDNINSTKSFLE